MSHSPVQINASVPSDPPFPAEHETAEHDTHHTDSSTPEEYEDVERADRIPLGLPEKYNLPSDEDDDEPHDKRTSWEFERDRRLARLASRESSRSRKPHISEPSSLKAGESGDIQPLSRQQSFINTIRARRTISREDGQEAIAGGSDRRFYHPLSHTKTSGDVLVDFDDSNDPYKPLNWPFKKKVLTTFLYGMTTFGTTFNSAIFSTGTAQVAADYHVSNEVSVLGTSLFLFGMGVGPLIWAPLSEMYGRKAAVLTPFFISALFTFATATSENIQTICITRFFGGFFGSAPVTNTGGVMGDLWAPAVRANAISGYAMAVVGGPTLAPLIGGAIVSSYLGWRWTQYVTAIYSMAILVADLIFLDESYPPVLLVYKAQRLRHETGNWALHAHHEEWDVSLKELARKYLIRPFALLATPICFLVALYASFVYGIVYAYLSAFPLIFQDVRGWSPVVGALPFLAILVGIWIGVPINLTNQKFYMKRLKANKGRPVPEARLPPMCIGSLSFTAGLFIFTWTCAPARIFWFAPIVGCALMGTGFFLIFQSALNYLVDTFQRFGASAVAANTFLRSVFAGAFPLFINYEFAAIGPNWGLMVFACFSVLLVPIPYVFYVFGRQIRARGKWSRESL